MTMMMMMIRNIQKKVKKKRRKTDSKYGNVMTFFHFVPSNLDR